MKKLLLVIALLSIVGCSESEEEKLKRENLALQNKLNRQQVVQQPAVAPAPVIINQQPTQSSNSGINDMLTGALVAHTVGNMLSNNDRGSDTHVIERERIVEKPVYINQPQPVVNQVQPTQTTNVQPAPTITQPVPDKPKSAMDMNKLSASASTGIPVTPPVQNVQKSSMDMSKLSSSSVSKPTVSLAKPSSSMNMSKLGSHGKR